MFSIQKKKENGFNKIILIDEQSGTVAEIVPECAAMLHSFIVKKNGEAFNVIDSYESLEEFKNNVKEKGYKGCKLSPFVCRIRDSKYTFGQQEYHLEKSIPAQHALHGELYDRSFELINEQSDENSAFVTLRYDYNKEDPGYPFHYECIVTWTLEADNKITVLTKCINKDEGLIPMQDGWHPYFHLGKRIDELYLEFQSMEKVAFDNDLMPTGDLTEYDEFNSLKKIGETVFDNCFTLNHDTCQPMSVLRNSDDGIQVEIYPDRSYPYLQIYSPDHRKSIAIENLSGPPNAFNNGMEFQTLEPGSEVNYKVAYKVQLLNNDHE